MIEIKTNNKSHELELIIIEVVSIIEQEISSLKYLESLIEDQTEVLKRSDTSVFGYFSKVVKDIVIDLDSLRSSREKLILRIEPTLKERDTDKNIKQLISIIYGRDRHLGSALLNARHFLQQQGMATKTRCDELEFTIKYTVGLNQDLLKNFQSIAVAPDVTSGLNGNNNQPGQSWSTV